MEKCNRFFIYALLSVFLLAGCGKKGTDKSASEDADILVMVGDSVLTMRDVLVKIPSGLPAADSILLFQSIVDGWMERNLLSDLAEDRIDNINEIDRMVEDYRKKLIIASYRRKLRESYEDGVSKKDVENYYKLHGSQMLLERPVVRGLYLKLPSDAARINDIRRWMQTATPDAIDNLEKYGLTEAIEYSFFQNRWMDWDLLARQIPYRFDNADSFVAENTDFETSRRGITYLVHISAYLPSGQQMPFEVASAEISERLSESNGEKYEERLMDALYQQARKSGKLKCVNYDPFEHKIISTSDNAGEQQ